LVLCVGLVGGCFWMVVVPPGRASTTTEVVRPISTSLARKPLKASTLGRPPLRKHHRRDLTEGHTLMWVRCPPQATTSELNSQREGGGGGWWGGGGGVLGGGGGWGGGGVGWWGLFGGGGWGGGWGFVVLRKNIRKKAEKGHPNPSEKRNLAF